MDNILYAVHGAAKCVVLILLLRKNTQDWTKKVVVKLGNQITVEQICSAYYCGQNK